jgi:hypothetical protein
MKTLIMISLFVGSFAMAKNTEVLAQVSPVNAKIKAVRLMDSGELQIENNSGAQATVQLSEENASNFNNIVDVLKNAKIQTDKKVVICMIMMPAFSMQVLSVKNEKTDKLMTVLTNNSCAIMNYTHPTEEYVLQDAQIFKANLMVLANQYASEQ